MKHLADGTHLGAAVLLVYEAHQRAKGAAVNPAHASGAILLGLSCTAETLGQPQGLFGDLQVPDLVPGLPDDTAARRTMRREIISHLQSQQFKPGLVVMHSPFDGRLMIHGSLPKGKGQPMSLAFVGTEMLVGIATGAIRELGKKPADRLKVFRSGGPGNDLQTWQQVQRELAMDLKAEKPAHPVVVRLFGHPPGRAMPIKGRHLNGQLVTAHA